MNGSVPATHPWNSWHPPPRADVMLAGLFSLAMVAAAVLYSQVNSGHRDLDATGVVLILLIAGAIAVRQWPMLALTVSLAALAPYHLAAYPPEIVLPAVMVLLYTIAVTGPLVRAISTGLVVLMVILLSMRFSVNGWPGNEAIDAVGWLIAAMAFGYAIQAQRAHSATLEERAIRAEHTREQEALRRVAEERLRIARDLHDVMAHHIAVISMQSSVAAYLIDQREEHADPHLAELSKSLHQIADAGGLTMSELRSMLEMLRGTETDSGERDVVPGLERLPELIASARSGGVSVEITETGQRRDLPATVDVAAYRIIQEALTNVSKHAGATHTEVSIAYRPDDVRIAITDNGDHPSAAEIVPGLGLTGMTERVNLVGGSMRYGPRSDAPGFIVEAILPVGEQINPMAEQRGAVE